MRSRGVTTIGRTDCDLSFPNDNLLSTPHASISHTEEGYFLRDDGGKSGVFLRLPVARPRPLDNHDLVRVGRQFLLLEADPPQVVHYNSVGSEVGRYPLSEHTLVAGRKAPDITLDADDRTLSRRHLAISISDGIVSVKDLKSANGSFLRVKSAIPIEHGQQFQVGQQVLALSIGDLVLDLPTPESGFISAPLAVSAALRAQQAKDAAAQGLSVTFQPLGKTVAVLPGQTLCEAAESAGIELRAECHSGICGSDPIRIISGAEHLEPLDAQETETLEDICELAPGPCRLACMARINGPVEVEIVAD